MDSKAPVGGPAWGHAGEARYAMIKAYSEVKKDVLRATFSQSGLPWAITWRQSFQGYKLQKKKKKWLGLPRRENWASVFLAWGWNCKAG